MSLRLLSKFTTLYFLVDIKVDGGKLSTCPSIGEFGRLHFSKGEIAHLDQKEKEKENKMAFTTVDKSELPVTERGRAATNPRVGVAGNGQITFNSLISKEWEGVDRLIIQFDPDTNRVAFIGVKAGVTLKNIPNNKMFKVGGGKSKDKDGKEVEKALYTAASSFLKNVTKYDYSAAGNQVYDAVFNDKTKAFIIALPTETPKPRPVVARKPKAAKVATAPAVAVEAPSEEELTIE